eukprot:TRINITY_DN8254_c0_g1_i1.p1 TRINITY_DN8254_c0_g1~~TRINITY_DN8254_c0_g1_i1.p1  ORF type:complete len:311 (-),score=-13.38 TRINITY_DN8254_c0_g1_i1:559-1491(-)
MASPQLDWVHLLKQAAHVQSFPRDWTDQTERQQQQQMGWQAESLQSPHAPQRDASPEAVSQNLWRPCSSAQRPVSLPPLEPYNLLSPSASLDVARLSPGALCVPSPVDGGNCNAFAQVSLPSPSPVSASDLPLLVKLATVAGKQNRETTELLLQGLLSSTPLNRRIAALSLVLMLDGEPQSTGQCDQMVSDDQEGSPSSPCSSVGSCDDAMGCDDLMDTAVSSNSRADYTEEPAHVNEIAATSYRSFVCAEDVNEAASHHDGASCCQAPEAPAQQDGGEDDHEFWQQQRRQLVEAIQALLQSGARLPVAA